MCRDFVSQQIRRTNRNFLILRTAVLAIVATAVSFIFEFLIPSAGLSLVELPLFRMARPEKHALFAKLETYARRHDVRSRIDSERRCEGGGEKFVAYGSQRIG